MRLRVRGTDGTAIADAEVSLTPLDALDGPKEHPLVDWGRVASASEWQRTDASGECTFALESAALDRTPREVIWITHPGFLVAHVLLDGSESGPLDVVLTPAPPCRARVESTEVAPELACTIKVMGSVRAHERSTLGPTETRALELFRRELRVTLDEWSRCFATDREVACIATAGDLASVPRFGPLSGDVRFELVPTFEFAGRVEPVANLSFADSTVASGSIESNYVAWLARAPVRADGTFGPVICATSDAAEWAFALNSNDVVSKFVRRPTPRAGERVVVTFEALSGRRLTIRAIDSDGKPLAGAAVLAEWADGRADQLVATAPMVTGQDGLASLCVPERTQFEVAAFKSGYGSARTGPHEWVEDSGSPLEIVLVRSGRVIGRVTREGMPVREFDVTLWPQRSYQDVRVVPFTEREDGTFAVPDVPMEPYLAFAHSPDFPRSEIVSLEFRDGVADCGDLALPDALRARGVVIDESTRDGIGGATVELWNSWGFTPLSRQGDPVLTRADGSFELTGLRTGNNVLWIRADGFLAALPTAHGEAGAEVDFGLVPLERGADVAVQLASDAPLDFTQFALETQLHVATPATHFPENGRIVLGGAGRGFIQLILTYPDASRLWSRLDLPRATPREVVHRVPDDAELELTFAAEVGQVESAAVDVCLRYFDDAGREWERWLSADPRASTRVNALRAGPCVIHASRGSEELARTSIELADGSANTVVLRLSAARKSLRFVEAGAPRAGGWIAMRPRGNHETPIEWRQCDADGRIDMPRPAEREWVVSAVGAPTRLGVAVILDDEDEQRIELGPGFPLEVHVRDRDARLAGISVWLEEPWTRQVALHATSDANGIARWADLGRARYRASIEGQGLWNAALDLEVGHDARTAVEFEVRRTGGVEFDVRGTLGEAVLGAELVLEHAELGEDLAAWTAEGRLVAPAHGWRSDATGRLRIAGIPRGEYRWSFALADGRSASGTVEIPPAGTASVQARLE
ncbi:MAG: hypothetical protein L6Q99_17185 [Planctomycetes bacterium]|nr:hypothetical protein [Planctomycetota bacterium]